MSALFSALTTGFVILVILGILLLLPTGTFPQEATDAITSTINYIRPWTFFINISQLVLVVSTVVFVEGAVWVLKGLFWLYSLVFKRTS